MKYFTITLLLFLVVSVDARSSNFTCYREMDPFESGTYQYLKPWINSLREKKKRYNSSYNVTMSHRRSGANHDHSSQMWSDLYRIGQVFINAAPSTGRKMIVPETIDDLFASLIEMKEVGVKMESELDSERKWKSISIDTWNEVVRVTNKILEEDKQFRNSFCSRSSYQQNQKKFTYNLSVEYQGIPLKLDFTDGSLSLKGTAKYGPWKFTGTAGFKNSTSNHGVELLAIVTKENRVRYYDIRNTKLSLYVEKSLLEINGKRMTLSEV